ncbi:6-bladed beta-propeller [Nitrosophilus alvini]|uniref:6-bladed beta-propeller n=1 Tax=Nitrosophilus alvini TaxID=2714855 RepID=UPI00190D6AFA|nr:6-bladed beta-propeller [Nitrosophilus alvini]
MKRTVLYLLSTILLLSMFTGCAPQKQQEVRIIMPPPPEEPRLFYVGSYRGEADFTNNKALDIFIGEETKGSGKNLFKPYGVAAKGDVLYVTDTALGIVFVIDIKNKKVTFLGDRPAGKLALPVGIAFGPDGIVYVSDSKLRKVFGYAKNGNLVFAIGEKGEFRRPSGIAINQKLNRLYVVDTKSHNVKVYDLKSGKLLFEFGKRGIKEGEFNFPTNIAIDPRNGNVAVVDTQNFRVQIFDQEGEFLTKFGRLGDAPGMFARPKGIGIDTEGHIYVADAAFNNVQIFDDKGTVLLYFGGAGFAPGKFYLPAGIYADENDRIYIVDSFNARVQVYQYVSEAWKKKHPEEYRKLKMLESTKKDEKTE